MSINTPAMSKEEEERLGVDIALFQEGIIKPFKEHVILDSDLYAKNQKKQIRYTEEALLSSGTCVYNHGADVAVEVVHKGDTKPLLAARDDAARARLIAAGKDRLTSGDPELVRLSARVRKAEAKKRTGDTFLASKKFHEALLVFDDALRALAPIADAAPGKLELEAQVHVQASLAALRLGQAKRSKESARKCLELLEVCDAKTARLAHFRSGCAKILLRDYADADDDLCKAGDAEAVLAARRKLRTKAAAAGVALALPEPPAPKPKAPHPPPPPVTRAGGGAGIGARQAPPPLSAEAETPPPDEEPDPEDVPPLSAADGSDVADVALDAWRDLTDEDHAANWRDGEKFSHARPVDWSSVKLPKNFPNPNEVSPTSVVVLTNAGFEEKHALAALRICRNELTKACDWLFKHRYAGDLDQVVRAYDKGTYDDERWNDEHFHNPKDAWLDPPNLPKAGERVPGKGVRDPEDYSKKGVSL